MKLAEPLQIYGMTLKNRIMMLSMGVPGQVGEITVIYFITRAKGGVAAMTISIITAWAQFLDNIEAMRSLTEAVHQTAPNCKVGIQSIPSGSPVNQKQFSPSERKGGSYDFIHNRTRQMHALRRLPG